MTNNYNRRDVIKKSSTVGVLASPILNSNLNKPPSTRVIEAALTYDIQNEDNYERFHTDSRPPYTIDHSKQQLVPLESASNNFKKQIHASSNLALEQPANNNQTVNLVGKTTKRKALPIKHSGRYRPKQSVFLDEQIQYPNAVVHLNSNAPALNIPNHGNITLPVKEQREIELAPITVDIRNKGARRRSIDGTSDSDTNQRSTTVEATPRIHAINHGELTIKPLSERNR